jgi:hypothetical protein
MFSLILCNLLIKLPGVKVACILFFSDCFARDLAVLVSTSTEDCASRKLIGLLIILNNAVTALFFNT